MRPRQLARLLLATRALPPRAALFQARAMLRAARLGDDWALQSSTRPADVALLPRSARERLELVAAPGHEARGEAIELLFVDSSHDRDATVAELRAWRPRLAPGALVVLHDYANPAYPGVAEAVAELGLGGPRPARLWV